MFQSFQRNVAVVISDFLCTNSIVSPNGLIFHALCLFLTGLLAVICVQQEK